MKRSRKETCSPGEINTWSRTRSTLQSLDHKQTLPPQTHQYGHIVYYVGCMFVKEKLCQGLILAFAKTLLTNLLLKEKKIQISFKDS